MIRRVAVWAGSALCCALLSFGLIGHTGLVSGWAQWMLSFLSAGFLLTVFASQPFLWLADRVFGLLPYSRDEAAGRRTPEVEKTAARFAGMFLFSTIVVGYNLGEFTVLVADRPWNWLLSGLISLMFLKFEITIFLYFQKSGIGKRLAVVLLVSSFTTVNFGLNILKPDIDDEIMAGRAVQAKKIYGEEKARIDQMFADKQNEIERAADKASDRARAAALAQAEADNIAFAGRVRALTDRVREAPGEREAARRRASVSGFIRDAKKGPDVDVRDVPADPMALAQARTERDQALVALNAMSQEQLLASQKGAIEGLSGFGARIQAFFAVVTKTFWTSSYFLMMFLVLTAIESLPVLTLGMRTPAYLWYLQCGAPSREDLIRFALENANLRVHLDKLVPAQVAEIGVLSEFFRAQLDTVRDYRRHLASVFQRTVVGDFTGMSAVRAELQMQYLGVKTAVQELSSVKLLSVYTGQLGVDMFDGREGEFASALVDAAVERERQRREAEEARRQAELEVRSRPNGVLHGVDNGGEAEISYPDASVSFGTRHP